MGFEMAKVKLKFHRRFSMYICSSPPGNMARSIVLLQSPLVICKMPGNKRPHFVIENRNILLTVNVSINWGECAYSKVGNTTPKHSRELYVSVFIWDNSNTVILLSPYIIFLSAPISTVVSSLKMILAQSISKDQFTFDLQNRSCLSRLNGPIIIFLDTGRSLTHESKSRHLIELFKIALLLNLAVTSFKVDRRVLRTIRNKVRLFSLPLRETFSMLPHSR